MTTVRVEYHREGDEWWADSPDVPGWTAGGSSLDEVRELARQGLPFFLEQDDVDLLESHDNRPVVVYTMRAVSDAVPTTAASRAEARFVGGPAVARPTVRTPA